MPIGPSRSLYGAIVVAALCLVAGPPVMSQAVAQPSETMDGWRQFKFGMAYEEARAIPSPDVS
jgi:hypothetical protein